jgi:Transcriptional regulator containing GAF, AAA-type ATPase, and DNA binding domains
MNYDWPGNVRELENTLERAAVMSEEGMIDNDAIILTKAVKQGFAGAASAAPQVAPAPATGEVDFNDPTLDERERLIAALDQTGWVQAKAARLLNMTPRQIAYRIQTMNIEVKKF